MEAPDFEIKVYKMVLASYSLPAPGVWGPWLGLQLQGLGVMLGGGLGRSSQPAPGLKGSRCGPGRGGFK